MSYVFSPFAIVDGAWSAWGIFGSCTNICGGGTQTRSRKCTNPAPANGGRNCEGASSETKACNEHRCSGKSVFPVILSQIGLYPCTVGCRALWVI